MANDLAAFIPEVWAQEALMVLEENMVIANLVHRDFENEVARFGETVNTRRPGKFVMKRKVKGDDVTVQDATAENVPVVLNQHIHTSFLVEDEDTSKSFQDLRAIYLVEAVKSLARGTDEMLLGETYQYLANAAGKLGTAATKASIIDTRTKMSNNKVPLDGRNFIITPDTEGALLNVAEFVEAHKRGDDGSAIREAHLGRLMGFDFFMCQNAPAVAAGSSTEVAEVDNIGGYAAGTTVLAIDNTSLDLTAGSWCTIVGDMTPQKIISATGSPTTQITISPGLRSAVANDADVTVYLPGAVDLSAGYASGWSKAITVKDFTVAPQTGQMVTFDAAAAKAVYSALSTPTTTSLLLNKPLEDAESNNDVVGLGPAGQYNLAFHRNALALVSRPLAAPAPGTGALSFVANYNGLGLRATITYDGNKQGHLVTLDMLCGIKVLDTDLGAVMLA